MNTENINNNISYLYNFLNTKSGNIPPFYLILDISTCIQKNISPIELFYVTQSEGLRLFQYRNKNSNLTQRKEDTLKFFDNVKPDKDTCILINDDLEVSMQLKVPCHLGQDDLPNDFSDKQKSFIHEIGYGASSHDKMELNRLKEFTYQSLGPVYSAFGAIFRSSTKPEVPISFHDLDDFFSMNPSDFSVLIGGISMQTFPILSEYLKSKKKKQRIFFAMIHAIFEFGYEEKNIGRCIRDLCKIIN